MHSVTVAYATFVLSILILTLPTQPNAVRVRIWRALKALGCAALRDGAYLLPESQRALFEPLAAELREHGGTATVLRLAPHDDAQRDELLALFDRSEAYAAWRDSATALQAELTTLAEAEARRRHRAVAEALAALRRTDHYPGAAAEQALAAASTVISGVGVFFFDAANSGAAHSSDRERASENARRAGNRSMRISRFIVSRRT